MKEEEDKDNKDKEEKEEEDNDNDNKVNKDSMDNKDKEEGEEGPQISFNDMMELPNEIFKLNKPCVKRAGALLVLLIKTRCPRSRGPLASTLPP